jgi:hypothetical protein
MPIITPAHWHVLLNHLPIMGVPLVALLLCWGLLRHHDVVIRAALYGAVLMAAGSFVVDQTGDGAKNNIKQETWVNRDLIRAHENAADYANTAALVTGALALVVLVMARGGKPVRRISAMIVLLALLVTAAALARTGWEGGKIRHSEFHLSAPPTSQGIKANDS